MKTNFKDSQIAQWQRLAELIGGSTPSDAIAFVGVRYLPVIIANLEREVVIEENLAPNEFLLREANL